MERNICLGRNGWILSLTSPLILNPHEMINCPDYISTPQELCDAIREGDFLEWNDLCGPETSRSLENSTNVPPTVDEHNLQAVLEQMVEDDDIQQNLHAVLEQMVEDDDIQQNLHAVLEQMVEAEDNSESSVKKSNDFKFSIVAPSNSEIVVMKAPVSESNGGIGETVEAISDLHQASSREKWG